MRYVRNVRNHYSTVQDENVIDLELYFQIDCLELEKNLVKKFRTNFLSVSRSQNFACHFRHNNANDKPPKGTIKEVRRPTKRASGLLQRPLSPPNTETQKCWLYVFCSSRKTESN